MNDFSSLWSNLDKSVIEQLNRECDKLSGKPDGEWYDEVLYHIAKTGGKRIRPKFLLIMLDFFKYKIDDRSIKLGALVETLHQVSLLHDDVVDDAPKRRSEISVNLGWGPKTAILLGDFLLGRVLEVLSEDPDRKVISDFARASRALSRGILLEHEARYDFQVSDGLLSKIAQEKTGSLFRLSAEVSGRIVGLNENKVKTLAFAGELIGESFQLIDDCLDWVGGESIVGKPTGHDLLEGFVNRPLVRLREKKIFNITGHPKKHDIKKWKIWVKENIAEISDLIIEENIVEECISDAELLLKEAFEIMESILPKDCDFNPKVWLEIFSRRMK